MAAVSEALVVVELEADSSEEEEEVLEAAQVVPEQPLDLEELEEDKTN